MKQVLSFFIEFVNRSKTAPPPYFRKIQLICVALAIFSFLGMVLKWNIPEIQDVFSWHWVGVFLTAAFFSQQPNVDKPVQKTSDEGENPVKPPKEGEPNP